MDVYIDKSGRLWIIDFNPFCKNTDPLLFSWDELLSANAQDFQFRIVESDSSVRLNPNTIHRLPQELINLSSTEVQQKLEMDGFLDDKF